MWVTPNDVRMHKNMDTGQIQLWYLRGDKEGVYYPTKIVAEAAARLMFPTESESARYGRVFYRWFVPE